MFDRKVLKKRAKYVLAKSFFVSIVACFAVSLVRDLGTMVIFPNIPQIAKLGLMSGGRIYAIYIILALLILATIGVSVFIVGPLNVGLKNFMLRSADMDVDLHHLATPFKRNYKKIVWVTFVKNLFVFLWGLLGIIPVAVGFWYFKIGDRIMELDKLAKSGSVELAVSELSAMLTLLMIVVIIFLIPAFIKYLQYSMVEYILAQEHYGTALEIIGKSKEMMVGNKWAYIKLDLSFFGWVFFATFIFFGLGAYLVLPYFEQTYAQMYLEISGQGKDYTFYDVINPNGGYGNI